MQTVKYAGLSAAIAVLDCMIKAKIKKPLITKNRGFARNRFDDHPDAVAFVSVVLSAYMACCLLSGKKDPLGTSLILGGALSNTWERVFKGYVTDYIKLGSLVYNISDFAIFAGALILVIQNLTEEKEV